MLSSCYLFILFALAALTLQGRLSESAQTFSTSSNHRQRPSTAEQTFVRGMMAADHQFGLYMTLSETSRGGDSTVDVPERRMNPATQACEEAMIRAREAAFGLSQVIRQAKRMNDHSQ